MILKFEEKKTKLHPTGLFRGEISRIEEIISRFGTRQVEITVETMSLEGDREIRHIKY